MSIEIKKNFTFRGKTLMTKGQQLEKSNPTPTPVESLREFNIENVDDWFGKTGTDEYKPETFKVNGMTLQQISEVFDEVLVGDFYYDVDERIAYIFIDLTSCQLQDDNGYMGHNEDFDKVLFYYTYSYGGYYTFGLMLDDGGEERFVDEWELEDSVSYVGTITLVDNYDPNDY